jgi:hypothetical protein
VQAQADDAPVERVPIPVAICAAEQWLERIDRRLLHTRPVPGSADRMRQLQADRPLRQLSRELD